VTPLGIANLRLAATLVHAVPGLRARLRCADRPVADVGPPTDADEDADDLVHITPCAFRAAVGEVHRNPGAGDLPSLGFDPAIDIGLPPGGRVLPGGLYRVPCGARWLHAFVLCGPAGHYSPLVAGVLAERPAPPPAGGLGLRSDGLLDTTLCFFETDGASDPGGGRDRRTTELLGALLARFTAEQVCGTAVAAR
jgi:hypothetical protein